MAEWEELPQPEDIEKQAGWGKIGGIGKLPQPEAIEKQADWGEIGGMGRTAPTGSHREASWLGKNWRNRKECSNRKLKYAGCKFWLPRIGR